MPTSTRSPNSSLHPRLGVSSWSLNKSLARGDFALRDLPCLAARHGFSKLEICHFHLPSTDPDSLADLRAACADAGVELYTFLQDSGDITHPDPVRREHDIKEIEQGIDTAAALGAQHIRICAGDAAPSAETLALSAAGFTRLANRAKERGLTIVTENWHALLDDADSVLDLLGRVGSDIGLKLDFGNWPAPRKFDELPRIAPYAACTHAKAEFPEPGRIDRDDFVRCLDICADAGFSGPHILIFASPGDEWAGLDIMREIVAPYVG